MGWLHSVPERKSKDAKKNRYDQYGADHPYSGLPNIEGFEYISSLFLDCGICNAGMNGALPLSWQDLKAFDDCGRLELSSWEFTQLMNMSRSYCKWLTKGGKQQEIPDSVPYIDESKSAANYIIRQRQKIADNQRL